MEQASSSAGTARHPLAPYGSAETATAAPISDPLRDARGLSAALVAHFAEHVARCGTLPGDALRGEVTTVTRTCLELAAGVLEGRDVSAKIERLQRAGADWAREGIPIGTIHRAVHDGFALGFDLIVDATGSEDYARLAVTARRLFEVLAMVDSAFAVAYVREHRAVVAEQHTAVHTVASALLSGHSAATMARAGGIEIDESYYILALSIPTHPGNPIPGWTARWWPGASCGACNPSWPTAARAGRCRCSAPTAVPYCCPRARSPPPRWLPWWPDCPRRHRFPSPPR